MPFFFACPLVCLVCCAISLTFAFIRDPRRRCRRSIFAAAALVCLSLVAAPPKVNAQAVATRTIGTGFNAPTGIAVDSSGNVFVADQNGTAIFEIMAPNYTTTNSIAGSSLFGAISAMAFDSNGNLWVTDTEPGTIWEVEKSGGLYAAAATQINDDFVAPDGIAVDSSGNVFVSDAAYPLVFEMPAGNYGMATPLFIANSTFDSPAGIALDSSGNLFVCDPGNNQVQEIVKTGSDWRAFQLAINTTFSSPNAVVVEPGGNAIVLDEITPGVVNVLQAQEDYSLAEPINITTSPALKNPSALALDASGNVFITDTGNNRVIELLTGVTVSSVRPNSGPTLGGSAVNITGTNFTSPLSVKFGNVAAADVIVSSSTSIAATSPAGSAGTVDVTVTTSTGTSSISSSDHFTYANQLVATTVIPSVVMTQGVSASYTPVKASGGMSPYTYDISPSLPAGLSFNTATGAISGSPTVTLAQAFFAVIVTDADFNITGAEFSLTVNPSVAATLEIASQTLTQNETAAPFTPIMGSGGTTPLVYRVARQLPLGLSLNANTGQITGTPTGMSPATGYIVIVTDANGSTANNTFTLTVLGLPTIVWPMASPINYGQPLSDSTLSGGSASFSGNPLPGAFTWVSPATVSPAGAQFESVIFTPTDTADYATVSSTVSLTVNPPSYVVNTTADDSGMATNCTPQASTMSNTTDTACSLRDALLAAANADAANVYFDSTNVFPASNSAAQNTITLGSAGTLTIPSNTAIYGATTGSGAALANLVTINGGGPSNNFSIFTVNSGVTGAAIANLTITNGQSAGVGGGIYNQGTLTVSGSTLSGNSAAGNSAGQGGGGTYNQGTLTVSGSTFSGNFAVQGGGIYSSGALTVTNSTFSGNAVNGGFGGGIYSSGVLTVTNSTFSGNTVIGSGAGAGGGIANDSFLMMANSIVSGNLVNGSGGDLHGSYSDNGGNIVGINNGDTVNGTAINLSPLGNYGGSTQTMIPLPGSPAICAGLAANLVSGLTIDQRGYPNTNTAYTGYSSSSPCVDAGAVETSYSMSFTTQPTTVVQNAVMVPAPAVMLDESGSAFTNSSVTVTIPLMLTTGAGTLSGGSASTSAGVATYSSLSVSAADTDDVLTATLPLNPNLPTPLSITAMSSQFNVMLPAPTVSGISPSFGPAAGGTSVTITGANFTAATIVQFGSTSATSFTVASAAQIIATAPAGSSGTVDVIVTTPGGTSATSAADQFTYLAPPSISVSFSPASIALNNSSILTFTLTNPNAVSLSGVAFSNTLPAGLIFAAPSVNSICAGMFTVSQTTIGTNSTTLSPGASCTISIGVAGDALGSYTDTSGAVTSTQTGAGNTGSATLTVTAGTVTASVTAAGKIYDGSTTATITGCTLTGVIATDTGNVSCSASGASFESSGAANGIMVTATGISLSGSAAGNYTLASTKATTTANIAQAPLTITASNTSTIYGTVPSVTPAYSAFAGSDTAASLTTAPTCVSTVTTSTPAGSYTGANTCAGAVDANYNFTYGAGNAIVTQAAQTIHFTAPSSPVVYGVSPIALSATATSGSAVTFSVVSGPGTIAGSTLNVTGAGTIVVAANQAGNTSYTAAGQVMQSIVVTPAPIGITASSASMSYGGAVPTITASYAGFVNGDSAVSLTTRPTCSTTATSSSAVGSYTSSCTGAADANYNISYFAGTVTVSQTKLIVAANNATKTYGTANPAFTGSVTGAASSDLFTESFSTAATVSSPVGSYAIVPSAAGANLADYALSVTDGTLSVTQAASITTVGLSSATIAPGQNETITATVASTTTGTPTGMVSFYDGSALLNTATLSSGTASYSTTTLAAGVTHVITAKYSGDTNFTGSTSIATTGIAVGQLDFTIAISGPASATVTPGQSITYQATVTPLYGGYPGTVSFSVAGLPSGANVTFSPSSIAANSGPQTITATIVTAPAKAAIHSPSPDAGTRRVAPIALGFLALIGMGAVRRRSRTLCRLLSIVALLMGGAAATLISGCGVKGGFFAQAPENYTVTITATAGSIQHSTTVTLDVQ